MRKPKPKPKGKSQGTKSKVTSVILLLDRSGSMANVLDETISGVNHYLKDLRADTAKYGKVELTVVQFDSQSRDILHKREDPAKVPDWNRDTFVPRASTPLVDAMARTIQDGDPKQPTLFVTVTDGYENASREWTSIKLKALVEDRTRGGWTFVYLGADHDAFSQATQFGISAVNTMQFDKSNTGLAYGTISAGTKAFRASGGVGMANFTAQAAAESGESEQQLRDKLTKKGPNAPK